MIKKIATYSFILISLEIIFFLMAPVSAQPAQAQSYFQTPTPGADGRIIYIVQAGDQCSSLSMLTGVDINTLIQNNNLDENCQLTEGQELLLGVYEAPTESPETDLTPTSVLPTPTPFSGNGTICIYLFDDVNGNSQYEETENPIAGGEISLANRNGDVSLTGTTTLDNQSGLF